MKKRNSSTHYQDDCLFLGTETVLDELGEYIPMVTFDEFLEKLAPPQPQFHIDATIQSLKSGPEPALTSSNRWSHFPEDPKNSDYNETAAFSPMPDLFMKVVNAIIASSDGNLSEEGRVVDFLQNPNLAPTSDERYNESQPDGYLVLKSRNKDFSKDRSKEYIHWADIVVPCEYKRKASAVDLDDDVRKILWSMQHIMRDDVRHRATFGLTIENTTVRVWFSCRAWVIVSQEFDFIREPKKLIRLFAAFAFANENSLGFDTTIQPVPGERGQFYITVHADNSLQNPRKFQTRRTISSYGAEALRGRGTRVFEAVELDASLNPFGPSVVLKDFWIDSSHMREGDILRSLYEAADDDDRKLVRQYFLSTICHGDVLVGDDVDDTANALMRGLNIVEDHGKVFTLQQYPLPHYSIPAYGLEGLRESNRSQVRSYNQRYEHKTHYRVVFEEVCTPIETVKSFSDVMNALKDTADALRVLRKLGWVHRDVSIGNILSYQKRGKLADLEYAKKASDLTSHEMRTGTREFMSVEVIAQDFLFLPNPGPVQTELDQFLAAEEMVNTNAPSNAPFLPNHLHDLESLWWVAVWVVFHNYVGTPPSLTKKDTTEHLRLAQDLFRPTTIAGVDTRRDNLIFSHRFARTCAQLPMDNLQVANHLDFLRQRLTDHYRSFEADLPKSVNANTSSDIYTDFNIVFDKLKQDFHSSKLHFILTHHKSLLNREQEGENSKCPRSVSSAGLAISKEI